VDQPLVASGKPPYARRLASTIFLHSLTQGIASGVEPADLMLAVVQPEDDPAVIGRALERLYDQAWFLEYDGHRYRFKTEPSLNKIIADETTHAGLSKAKVEIENRMRQIWRKGYFKPEFFPVEPGEVDDDAEQPRLVLMHFEAVKAGACDVFLRKSGLKSDGTFKACLQALLNAVPRSRIKGKFVRPEAEVLENMRLAFFDDLQVKVKEEIEAAIVGQLGLGGGFEDSGSLEDNGDEEDQE
jgi:hypothetical protein